MQLSDSTELMLALASVQFTFFVDMEMDIVGKEEEGMTRSSCSQKIVCWQRMKSARGRRRKGKK